MRNKTLENGYKKIENGVVGGYQKIEDSVVGGYKKMETTVVEGFQKVTDKFVGEFFTREGETVEVKEEAADGYTELTAEEVTILEEV